MKIKLDGYAPDYDPTLPGVMVDCQNFIPSMRGYVGAPSAVATGTSALSAACQGAAVCFDLDDTNRLFAGTGTKMYERASDGTWTDQTRASGGDYALGADIRWSFTQFGNISLAVAKTDTLQYSNTGAFANVSGAPKASIVETVGQFVFLFDTNEATYGDSPNRWWCSEKGNYAGWTPSVPNECATGILTSAPGPIKAGKRFGDNIIAYKERAMFVGVYVGGGPIWDFREIPGNVGALGQYAVIDVGTAEEPKHIFMGADDFYKFDGARPIPIGNALTQTVFGELNRAYAHLTIAMRDRRNSRIFFYYCTNSTTPNRCVVYNYKTDKWGRDDRTIEMALQYVSPGITYADLGTYYSTYADLPAVAYDSGFWTARTFIPAVFDSAHTLYTLNGSSSTSSVTTGDIGDEVQDSCISRVAPRWLTKPTSSTLTNYYRANSGDALIQDQATVMDSAGRFDFMREAKWHRLKFDFAGPVELSQVDAQFVGGSKT